MTQPTPADAQPQTPESVAIAMKICACLLEDDSSRHMNCPVCWEDNSAHAADCLLAQLRAALSAAPKETQP